MNEKLNIEKIKNANTKILGKNIIYYPEIASTQDAAKESLHLTLENGTIFITDKQTNGKGTQGRSWYSTNGKNLTFTILLHPTCSIAQLEHLTIDVANAIKIAIKKYMDVDLSIKKPNDLLLAGKKISGILTQMGTQNEKIQYLLIGIGFNVNQTKFSEELKNIATSLQKECYKEYSREEILIKILEELEKEIAYCLF